MANKRLSDEVIAARMVELRNLRRLHAASRERERLKDTRITELEAHDVRQQQIIETLLIQVAELQTMVFGKKKRPPNGGTPAPKDDTRTASQKVPRSKDSYRRPLPQLRPLPRRWYHHCLTAAAVVGALTKPKPQSTTATKKTSPYRI